MTNPILHHVTLKTTRLQEMIEWYGVVVGMKPQHVAPILRRRRPARDNFPHMSRLSAGEAKRQKAGVAGGAEGIRTAMLLSFRALRRPIVTVAETRR